MLAADSVQSTGALNQESLLPSLEPAVTCTSGEIELSEGGDHVVAEAETLVEIATKPLPSEGSGISAVAEDMPKLERKDAAESCVAMDIPQESRSPSPPTLQHKDVVDTLPESDHSDENSLSPNFCRQESEEELNEVEVDDGKLASGNDVFLGNSLGGSSAGESGRSSTIAALRQRAGECDLDLADAESEKASELCNSRDFADSNDDMLRNGFSGSELSIHSGSPAVMSDVDSDENATMIGELFDAAATADGTPAVDENSKPASLAADKTEPSCDLDVLDKPAETGHSPSSELQVNSDSSDADNNLTCTETNANGASSPSSSESESEPSSFAQSPVADDTGSVIRTTSDGLDEHIVPAISEQSQQNGVVDDVIVSSVNQVLCQPVQNSSTTSVLEKLLNEPNLVPSSARRGPNLTTVVDSQFCPVIRHSELNKPSAMSSTAVTDSCFMEADDHLARAARQLSGDHQQFVGRSPTDVGQSSTVSQHGFAASPLSSSTTTQLGQFAPAFVNVGSPSLAGSVPRGSCPTPGMENVGSPYPSGYRRLSSGSGSHIQQHLVSPEMNAADQRMHSPASYCADYPSARQGSYAVRPLHDGSYQSAGGPHSVKSSPGAAVGSPSSGCAIMSPNGNYVRTQSFGSLTHSPATRVDQSPASAGSGGFGGSTSGLATQQVSFNQPNPSPSGSGATGRSIGGGAGLPNKSPVGNTNVFSPAPPAAMSPSVAVTSAMGLLSTPIQHANTAPFSCSPTDGVLPFHFPTNVAVPVSATTYASAPSPTPHSLQLLSPSNNSSRVSAGYQTVSTSANLARRNPRHQLPSSAVGLPPYYGILPSPPASMSYAGVIDHRFAEAPLDHLMSTFSAAAPPSGRQTAPISRTAPSDCSLVQLQQLTSRLGNQSAQQQLDISYGISASQSMGLLPPKADPFGRVVGMPGPAVNQACKQSGRRRAAASEKTSPVGSVPPVALPPHAAGYNMLEMFHPQHQPVSHGTPPLDYQRYFANAGFFGQGASQLPMQMMPLGPAAGRSSTPFTPQPSSQTQGGSLMYSSYNYGRVPSDAFTDLPRR